MIRRPLAILAILLAFAISSCVSSSGREAPDSSDPPDTARVLIEAEGLYELRFEGPTMGTTYHLTYLDEEGRDFSHAVDSLLQRFNLAFSTYDSAALLARFNQGERKVEWCGREADWLEELYHMSAGVHFRTKGAFDPTVMPLVRYWGFFTEDPFSGARAAEQSVLDSLLTFVGFDRLELEPTDPHLEEPGCAGLQSADPRLELDFNAVAKGFGVDLIGRFLEEKGVERYLFEIGGEVLARGRNAKGQSWGIAMEKPLEGRREFHALIGLELGAMATSGNYRRYWEREGRKYGHTLNPSTGRPEMSNLLSVSVIARSCAFADAYSTAFMVMGLEKGLALAEELDALEAYFIFLDPEGEMAAAQTAGFSPYVLEPAR